MIGLDFKIKDKTHSKPKENTQHNFGTYFGPLIDILYICSMKLEQIRISISHISCHACFPFVNITVDGAGRTISNPPAPLPVTAWLRVRLTFLKMPFIEYPQGSKRCSFITAFGMIRSIPDFCKRTWCCIIHTIDKG